MRSVLKFISSFKFTLPLTAVLMTISIVVYPTDWFLSVPLYFSLGIAVLSSRASRFTYLFGALNSLLYTLSSLYLGLYGSVLSNFLIGVVAQFVTFVLWSKNKYKQSTTFKKLSKRALIITILISAVAWIIGYISLSSSGGKYILTDNSATISNFVCQTLTLLSFKEYIYPGFSTTIFNTLTYILMLSENPAVVTYIIVNLFTLLSQFKARRLIRDLYVEQQAQESLQA